MMVGMDHTRDEHGHPKGHDHEHGHSHGPSLATAGTRHIKPLGISFVLIGGYFFVELIAGFWTGSLALLSDAGHMLTDVIGLGMALAAIQLAIRHKSETGSRHTFGLYRLEILAAFVNALLLFAVAIYVLIEAVQRFSANDQELLGVPMLIVATIGLVVNIIVFFLLREGAKESLNMKGAYLEVVADMLGSVAVIAAAVIYEFTGWSWIDPLFAAVIGLWILPRTYHLGRQALMVLLQSAPSHIDLDDLGNQLESIGDVVDVHELHVWTLTSQMESVSAHLTALDGADHHSILDQARELVAATYGIDHTTFQIEPESHVGCQQDCTW